MMREPFMIAGVDGYSHTYLYRHSDHDWTRIVVGNTFLTNAARS